MPGPLRPATDDALECLPLNTILTNLLQIIDQVQPGLAQAFRETSRLEGGRSDFIWSMKRDRKESFKELERIDEQITALPRLRLQHPHLFTERYRETRIQETREILWMTKWWPLLSAIGVSILEDVPGGHDGVLARRAELESVRQECVWVCEQLDGDRQPKHSDSCSPYEADVAHILSSSHASTFCKFYV